MRTRSKKGRKVTSVFVGRLAFKRYSNMLEDAQVKRVAMCDGSACVVLSTSEQARARSIRNFSLVSCPTSASTKCSPELLDLMLSQEEYPRPLPPASLLIANKSFLTREYTHT